MLKKTMTYTDYNGVSRTGDFYFNLSKAELIEMSYSVEGGLDEYIRKIIDENDYSKLLSYFKKLVKMSYGEKTTDGKRFIKSEELTEAFTQTEAFSDLFVELATNAESALEFIRGIIPADISSEVEKTAEYKEATKMIGQ
jgi:predicted CopG family antitoxin